MRRRFTTIHLGARASTFCGRLYHREHLMTTSNLADVTCYLCIAQVAALTEYGVCWSCGASCDPAATNCRNCKATVRLTHDSTTEVNG